MMRENGEGKRRREKSKTMTSDADDRRSYCKNFQVRIALSDQTYDTV